MYMTARMAINGSCVIRYEVWCHKSTDVIRTVNTTIHVCCCYFGWVLWCVIGRSKIWVSSLKSVNRYGIAKIWRISKTQERRKKSCENLFVYHFRRPFLIFKRQNVSNGILFLKTHQTKRKHVRNSSVKAYNILFFIKPQ